MRHDRRVGRYYVTECSEVWDSIYDLDSPTGKLLFTKFADDIELYDEVSIKDMYEFVPSFEKENRFIEIVPKNSENSCRVIPKTTELNPFFEDLCLLAYVLSFTNKYLYFDFLIDKCNFIKTKYYVDVKDNVKHKYVTINIKRLFLEFSKILEYKYDKDSGEVSDSGKDIVFDFDKLPGIEERKEKIFFSTGYHNIANINDLIRLFDYLSTVPDSCEFMYWCYEHLSYDYKRFVEDIFSDVSGNCELPRFKINPFTYELCIHIQSFPCGRDSLKKFIADHLFRNSDNPSLFPVKVNAKTVTIDVYKLSELLDKRFYGNEVLSQLKSIVSVGSRNKKTVSSIPISFRKSLKKELSWLLSSLDSYQLYDDLSDYYTLEEISAIRELGERMSEGIENLKFKFKENFCVEITLPQS